MIVYPFKLLEYASLGLDGRVSLQYSKKGIQYFYSGEMHLLFESKKQKYSNVKYLDTTDIHILS